MTITRSKMMDELYGVEESKRVYARLDELSPAFNKEVQKVYDYYWALPGLNTREKSLVSVASVISLRKAEQSRIHLTGLLNLSKSAEELVNFILYLSTLIDADSARKGRAVLADVLKEKKLSPANLDQLSQNCDSKSCDKDFSKKLNKKDWHIIRIATQVALGDIEASQKVMKEFLEDNGSAEDIKNILIHQIVYCGFPTAMNGFAALKNVKNGKM